MAWCDISRHRLRNDFKMHNVHSKIWTKSHSLQKCKRIFSVDVINEVGEGLFQQAQVTHIGRFVRINTLAFCGLTADRTVIQQMKLPRIQASKIQFFKPFFIVNYLFNTLTFKHRLHSLTIFSLPPSFPSLFLLFKSVSKQLGEANLVKVQRGISGSQPQCLAITNDTHRGEMYLCSLKTFIFFPHPTTSVF